MLLDGPVKPQRMLGKPIYPQWDPLKSAGLTLLIPKVSEATSVFGRTNICTYMYSTFMLTFANPRGDRGLELAFKPFPAPGVIFCPKTEIFRYVTKSIVLSISSLYDYMTMTTSTVASMKFEKRLGLNIQTFHKTDGVRARMP